MAQNKTERRQKIKWRIRSRIKGTQVRPRLTVYRSNKAIYAQWIVYRDWEKIGRASCRERV